MHEPLLFISSIITAGLRRRLRELDSDDMGEDPLDATDGRRAVPGEVVVCRLPLDNLAENVLSLTRRGSFLFFPVACSA